jgi:hypothetical protein
LLKEHRFIKRIITCNEIWISFIECILLCVTITREFLFTINTTDIFTCIFI